MNRSSRPARRSTLHELTKNRRIEEIAANLALEVTFFNLSEYIKGGALLSCMVMHLNRSPTR